MPAGVADPLFDPDVVEDPHSYYAQLRASDPVDELQGAGTFLVTRMDLIHEVVAKPEVFSSVSASPRDFPRLSTASTAAMGAGLPDVAVRTIVR
jgi:cytochrome P450